MAAQTAEEAGYEEKMEKEAVEIAEERAPEAEEAPKNAETDARGAVAAAAETAKGSKAAAESAKASSPETATAAKPSFPTGKQRRDMRQTEAKQQIIDQALQSVQNADDALLPYMMRGMEASGSHAAAELASRGVKGAKGSSSVTEQAEAVEATAAGDSGQAWPKNSMSPMQAVFNPWTRKQQRKRRRLREAILWLKRGGHCAREGDTARTERGTLREERGAAREGDTARTAGILHEILIRREEILDAHNGEFRERMARVEGLLVPMDSAQYVLRRRRQATKQ